MGWRRGEAFCAATNRDGKPCGNKVATLPSGAVVYRKCAIHRRAAERVRREARERVVA
jgi:hypothetical protein